MPRSPTSAWFAEGRTQQPDTRRSRHLGFKRHHAGFAACRDEFDQIVQSLPLLGMEAVFHVSGVLRQCTHPQGSRQPLELMRNVPGSLGIAG